MIDLSFLTEEEQEAIMKVLQRDAELKKAEEERVRHLPEKVKDDVQLKNMSGQWFYEAKSKRHRDKIHGADIIRASMRRKPATLAEVSQNKSNKAKNSWVSNVHKEVFVPPELHGIVEHQEEEQLKSSSSSKLIMSVLDKPEERPTKAAISPVKQRRNPFNSTASGDNLNSGESENRPAALPQLSKKEILSLSEESQAKPNLQNKETEKHKRLSMEPPDESQKGLDKRPVPKARKLIHKATDPVSQREDFLLKPAKQTERINGTGTPPRGILKRSSSSSSTDSEVRASQVLDVQKKNGPPTATIFEGEAENNSPTEVEDSTQISLEKLKQVRFSSNTRKGEPLQSPQLHHGREAGEFDLLEPDERKSSGSEAVRSDSAENKQTPAVKPLGTYSSAVQIKTKYGLQKDTSASSPCNTERSVSLVNETLQTTTVTPEKLESPQTSSNVLPNSNELSVDETHENKYNQILSRESKSHKNVTDEHQLSPKIEAHEVSNSNSTSLQQGKPDLVEERDAKTTFKPDKHADELMEVADESVSKVLDWFKRSSGTEDGKHVSARSQGREPKEEVDSSAGTAVLSTEHSGSSMDGKTEGTEELPFGKFKQQNRILPTSFISEDVQMMKERMKPKKAEENDGQTDKSQTEVDCTRIEEKEHGQEIRQQNKKSNLLKHQEHKLPKLPQAQKYESEKAIREKRRIREIRAFWERDKSIPSHEEKEDSNSSGGSAMKGLGESDKIKPTAVNFPRGLDDQSKNTLRSAELSCASQASRNEHQSSSEFGSSCAAEKSERTLPSNGEVHEYAELPKASNLQPRGGATSASPERKDKDEKETLKEAAACSQEKPSFQVSSLKEKMNEKSKNHISYPSQFQSLRNFWDTGVKLHSSIDSENVSLPNNTSSITYERKSKEDKRGRDNVRKQELIQHQSQTSERQNPLKLDFVEYELPLGFPTLKGLNVTHKKNTDSIQLDRKPGLSKLQEKMGLPEQEVKECIEKSIFSSEEHHVSLQLLQSPGDNDVLKKTTMDDCLYLPIEEVENKSNLLDASFSKEEVAETVDKVFLPKDDLDVFKLGLKKLEKEASEMSTSLNLKENISKGTSFHSNQCKVFERTAEQSHDISPADQKEEIGKSRGKVNILSTDEHENKKSLRRLFREFEPFHLGHQAADKNYTLEGSQRPQADLQNLLRETFASQPSEYSRVGIKTSDDTNSISQTNCTLESTCQDETGWPEEINETTEKSVAPPKVSGLSSALEKLLKEASETPPPKPKRADSTVQRTGGMDFKSTTYEDHGQEVSETIEKSVAPFKVSDLSSALEKLLKEASETPPPKPRRANSTLWRTAKMEAKSMTYKHDEELPQEIDETVENSVAPSKVTGLSSTLEKLLKEASETPPPKPKRADITVQRTGGMDHKSTTYEHDEELPQEVSETIERSEVSKVEYGIFDVYLQKLLKEVSETPASVLEDMDEKIQGKIQTNLSMHAPHQQDRDHPQEIPETTEKNSISDFAKFSEFSCSLEKLHKEASEVSCLISKELNKQEQFGDHVFQSQKETLFLTRSQPHNAESSYRTQMKIAIKGRAPQQNIKASVNDLAVSEIEASDLLKRSGAINKIEKRNMVPVDLPPLEGETSMIAMKPFQINEKGGRDKSTSLDASEKNSEFKALLEFRRTSTPLTDESSSPQPEGAQLCLMFQREEEDGSSLGSMFSDENSDSHSGTGSTTCEPFDF